MYSGAILSIFAFGLFFSIDPTFAAPGVSGTPKHLPRNEDGDVICNPGDIFCEQFRGMIGSPQDSAFQRNYDFGGFDDLGTFRKGGGNGKFPFAPSKCASNWDKKLCEAAGKTCYTDGRCGDLVNEETH